MYRDAIALVYPNAAIQDDYFHIIENIWRHSKNELGARQRLGKLRRRSEVQPETGYTKAVSFLVDRFDDMVPFLRVPGVSRNALAESGMRCLRRLEQGHDGFRSQLGRQSHVCLYQAIRDCNWKVYHRSDGLLILSAVLPSHTAASAALAQRRRSCTVSRHAGPPGAAPRGRSCARRRPERLTRPLRSPELPGLSLDHGGPVELRCHASGSRGTHSGNREA